jgi:colanic acid/amylovoran biosynthesis protein
MKIFVMGQCTLHWGRMEYGNIGNYYIIEPFFQELHRVFPDADIVTTLQMTDGFCRKENIRVTPIDLYYGWQENDLDIALEEFAIASIYNETGIILKKTPYMEEIINSDLIIDFSGDMWGDNADLLGKDRFLIGLLKDRVAQLLKVPTVMLAGSPGPFQNHKYILPFARTVYKNFIFVTNREKISTVLLKNDGFDITKTIDLACPSFLFEAAGDSGIQNFINTVSMVKDKNTNKTIVGFILCGWNMVEGPFNKWPRKDTEYSQFIHIIEYLVSELKSIVCLMSHSNGFELSPDFQLINGRDFYLCKQLYNLLDDTIKERVVLLDSICLPAETKAIIRQFDMLISGRVHGAIAALSQNIPTVILDYGHTPKAHKLQGFAQLLGIQEYIADPTSIVDMIEKTSNCLNNREIISKKLKKQNISVNKMARQNFDLLRTIVKQYKCKNEPRMCLL